MVIDEGCVDEEDLRWLDQQGRHNYRHDFETNPIQAVMMCEWHERDYSLGGTHRVPDQCVDGQATAAL